MPITRIGTGRRALTAFLLLTAAVPTAAAQPVGAADARFAAIRDTIRAVLTTTGVPSISVAVAHRGVIQWAEAFGHADVAAARPATPQTMYSLASISKPFTATAVMRLVEHGQLDLDAPANRHLGAATLRAFAGHADSATVRRLLTHTAGLPLHYQFFYAGGPPAGTMEAAIAKYGVLTLAPGSRYFYSNFGFGVLDHIVARTSGMPFADYMRREILDPLGLSRTTISDGSDLGDRAAIRYGPDQQPIAPYTFDHVGASGFWSSAHDLVRFGMFHVGTPAPDARAVLQPGARAQMYRTLGAAGPPTAATAGLGWQVVANDRGLTRISHTGGMPGVSTVLNLYPAESLVVVVLANASTPAVGRLANLIRHVVVPITVPPTPPPVTPRPAWRLTGEYRGPWGGTITLPDGTLSMVIEADPEGVPRIRIGRDAPVLMTNATLADGWVSGGGGRIARGPDATPGSDTAGVNAAWNLELRDGRLAGWVSVLSRANPSYGAVSYPVSLARVPGGPPSTERSARDMARY